MAERTPWRAAATLFLSLAGAYPLLGDEVEKGSLVLGQPVVATLPPETTHFYSVSASRDHYLTVVVEQLGADLHVSLIGPEGKPFLESDRPNGPEGPEVLRWVARDGGTQRLAVRPSDQTQPETSYRIRWADHHMPVTGDLDRITLQAEAHQAKEGARSGDATSVRLALEKYRTAAAGWRALGEGIEEADLLTEIARLESGLGADAEALKTLEVALGLYRRLEYPIAQAVTLNLMGLSYSRLGDDRRALDFFAEALPLARATFAKTLTLNNRALSHDKLGDRESALQDYEAALALFRSGPSADWARFGTAAVLHNIADLRSALGDKQQALDSALQAAALFRDIGNARALATSLATLGRLYFSVGEHDAALRYLEEALSIRRKTGDQRGEGYDLNALGSVRRTIGQTAAALSLYGQALAIHRHTGDKRAEATTLTNLAITQALLRHPTEAAATYNEALVRHRAIANKWGEAMTLVHFAEFHHEQLRVQDAADGFTASLALFSELSDPMGAAKALKGIALVHRDAGRLTAARDAIEEALSRVEGLRTSIDNQHLRTTYFTSIQPFFDLAVEISMGLHAADPDAGHDRTAFHLSERAKARSFVEMLTAAHLDVYADVAPDLMALERSVSRRLNAAAYRHAAVLRGDRRGDIKTLSRQLDQLASEHRQLQLRLRTDDPHRSAFAAPYPPTVAEVQGLLDADTVLLKYHVGRQRAYAWVVGQTNTASFVLSNPARIDALARDLRSVAEARNRERMAHAEARVEDLSRALSQAVLAPVMPRLRGRRVIVVPDGALHYIPFGILPLGTVREGGSPLIARFEVVSLPSAGVVAAVAQQRSRARARKTAAVFADPVFEAADPRLKRSSEGFEVPATDGPFSRVRDRFRLTRLPFTRREARVIEELISPSDRFVALDFSASRAAVEEATLADYRVLHFATHGLVDDANPELSGLVLSLFDKNGQPQDGYLRLHEVLKLRLRSDLVVLSACQTAVGREYRGEGLAALPRAFIAAGARRVVASLWSTTDEAAASLMSHFYRYLLVDHRRPADALRMAQLEMRRERRWGSAIDWGGFVLQGDWR